MIGLLLDGPCWRDRVVEREIVSLVAGSTLGRLSTAADLLTSGCVSWRQVGVREIRRCAFVVYRCRVGPACSVTGDTCRRITRDRVHGVPKVVARLLASAHVSCGKPYGSGTVRAICMCPGGPDDVRLMGSWCWAGAVSSGRSVTSLWLRQAGLGSRPGTCSRTPSGKRTRVGAASLCAGGQKVCGCWLLG